MARNCAASCSSHVDREAFRETLERVDEFVAGDLEDGIPPEVGTGFDVVIAGDVLEHLREPERLLDGLGLIDQAIDQLRVAKKAGT